MNSGFDYLTELPGTPAEQAWLQKRLETLSVRESCVFTAALTRQPPASMADAVNHLQSLDDYAVCFPAGSYKQLGEFYLRRDSSVPESVYPYVDLTGLGRQYEDTHPGLFIGKCYVEYPMEVSYYYGRDSPLPEDTGWSVKMKLATPDDPSGVWIRFPDFAAIHAEDAEEVLLALDALGVQNLEDCVLLDARCILPEAGNLMGQYDSVMELARDGNDLGIVLDERNQGLQDFEARFAAALEYENCRSLRLALDISQNLSCYEWLSCERLVDFAVNHLQSCGVTAELIQSGAIDLERYAMDLLETSGYMLTHDERGYVLRNSQEFLYERSAPPGNIHMTMQ